MNNATLKQLDRIAREETAFTSFADLVNTNRNYRPSIDQSNARLVILADAYDQEMLNRGDERRAYRYGKTGLNIKTVSRQDIIDAIRDAKDAVRTSDADGKTITSGTWQVHAMDRDGNRLEEIYDEGEGIPAKKVIARALEIEGVSSVWISGETYWIDTSLPIAEQFEHRDNTGEGWDVEFHN